jgi:hypothetical protein
MTFTQQEVTQLATDDEAWNQNQFAENPEKLDLFIEEQLGFYHFSLILGRLAYLSNVAFIVTDFRFRSDAILLIFSALHIKSDANQETPLLIFNTVASILSSIACLTFSPKSTARNIMLQWAKQPKKGLLGYCDALFLNHARKNKILFIAFTGMSMSAGMLSTYTLQMLFNSNAKNYTWIYPLGSVLLILSSVLYYFFFSYNDVMQNTYSGLLAFKKIFLQSFGGIQSENAIALVTLFHVISSILFRAFKMSYGPFIFMQNLKASTELSYMAAILGGFSSLLTAPAMRITSVSKVFYSSASQEQLEIAKQTYEHLSFCQKSFKLAMDPAIILLLGAAYVFPVMLSKLDLTEAVHIIIMIGVTLSVITLLFLLFFPAAKQKIINVLAKEEQNPITPSSLLTSTACAFYQFSQAVSLVFIMEKLFSSTFNTKNELGCLMTLSTLSLTSYLSYSAYKYQRPKVAESLPYLYERIASIPKNLKKLPLFFSCLKKENTTNSMIHVPLNDPGRNSNL